MRVSLILAIFMSLIFTACSESEKNEHTCDTSNPCANSAVPHKTICVPKGDDYRCACQKGYEENEAGACVLVPVEPCKENPCKEAHKTTCTETGTTIHDYTCSCDAGYKLKEDTCYALGNACDNNPCNGAHQTTCTSTGDTVADYECACDDGYHFDGKDCVETVDPCEPNPCTETHKTVCKANSQTAGDFTCQCDIGYQLNNGVCEESPMSAGCSLPKYKVIFDNDLEGLAMVNKLNEITGVNYNNLGYTGARNQLYNNVDLINNQNQCVYTGNWHSAGSGVNCEHTWPQSKGAFGDAKADMHHLFPTESSVNSSRGNLPFGVVDGDYGDEYGNCDNPNSSDYYCSKRGIDAYGTDVFEPADPHKGNVARAMFYFATRYGNRDNFINYDMRIVLSEWNKLDPVESRDILRNDRIEALQNNRNPYVDCPELLDRIDFETFIFPESY